MDKAEDIRDQFALLEKELKELREIAKETEIKILDIQLGLDFVLDDFNKFAENK